jgi:WD40 repeat protein/serine/threonine protein kinase
MPAPNQCARCGAELRSQNAEGFCARCLLEKALGESIEEHESLSSDEARTTTHVGGENALVEEGRVRLFGEYELLEEIARGGMGVVYRARQTSLERIVALKMILGGQFASKQIIQRFKGEVTAAALLQHPNIVAIHDVGIHADQHYFSMDYVNGLDLAHFVGNRPLAPKKAARYVKIIAQAIHYAHGQGILHRDLKPSNVLIDSVTDEPRITDFGLARRLDGESSLTLTGQVLGSPNFMPPEQAGGAGNHKVGRHSDVYGLGGILYYLLTARAPFQADSLETIVTQVLQADPVSPRSLDASVPRDLETISLKCLSKEPARRYVTAREVEEELDRFLHDKPIQARPISGAERAWRWSRRNLAAATLSLSLILAIIVGFSTIGWQLHRISNAERSARRDLYTANMNLAYRAWNEGNLQRPQELLKLYLPQDGKEDLRGFEWRYLWKLCEDESRHTFTNMQFAAARNKLSLGADPQTVVAASGDTLKWLDVQKGGELRSRTVGKAKITSLYAAPGRPGLIAYRTDRLEAQSPSGEMLLNGGLADWESHSHDPDYDRTFALSWDGTLLATSCTTTLQLFDVKSGQPLGPALNLGDNLITSLAFSPDGHLACGTFGTKIHILEVPSLKPINVLTGHTAAVSFLCFDRNGTKLVSSGGESRIRVWSYPEGRPLIEFANLGEDLDLAISPDGLRLAGGGMDHSIRIWNLAHPEAPPIFLHGHVGRVNSVLFSRDGRELYSASEDGTVKVWDEFSGNSTNILRHADWNDEASFSPDGKLVAVSDFNERTAVLWNLATRQRIGIVGKHSHECRGVRFSSDGKLIAVAGDYSVQVYDSSSLRQRFDFPTFSGGTSIAFHPLKSILAVSLKHLRFWDLSDGHMISLLPNAPTNGVEAVAFSPNAEWIALGMHDGTVSLWDLPKGRLSHTFNAHTKAINAICFSNDSTLLASGGWDGLVEVYDLHTSRATPLVGHFDTVHGLAFAPDDKTLVSTSADGTIRFWSMANHQTALTLSHGGAGIHSAAFSGDGNLMVTAGADGTARLWPAAKFEDIAATMKTKANSK